MAALADWHLAAVPWDVINWCENCCFGAIYAWTKGSFLLMAISWSLGACLSPTTEAFWHCFRIKWLVGMFGGVCGVLVALGLGSAGQ